MLIAALQAGNDEGLRDVLERAEEVGMDSEELVARYCRKLSTFCARVICQRCQGVGKRRLA
ncbi:hypothetical protein GCM10017056_48680 [Seohaeicola zhoushanensis]|uniref:Uncharacterized protein n=1 Tax=Seohaeicola zhoushanensis TaxID=1569283 RepID=A0A8J3MB15_9RHOB|nr:hypothetical protein GCM10017056_48680 [Seohaeicola zhoushanensis]